MSEVFYDAINGEIELGEGVDNLVRGSVLDGYFDREKLTGLAAAFSLVAFQQKNFRIACLSKKGDHLAVFLNDLAKLRGFEVELAVCDVPNLEDLRNFSPQLLVCEAGPFLHNELVREYARSAPIGSAIFLTTFEDLLRSQILLPKRGLSEALVTEGFVPIVESYFALFYKRNECGRRKTVSIIPSDQRRCLFVFGHARSGSSVISQVVNHQEDCLMTYEANWHAHSERGGAIDQFNAAREIYGRAIKKGNFLGVTHPVTASIEEIFDFYLQNYKFFGDKIAVGTREEAWERYEVDRAFEFLMGRFPFANYVITTRAPSESIAALDAMLGGRIASPLLMDWWVYSSWRLLSLFLVSDRSVLLPFNQISIGDLRPLERLCGRSFSPPPRLIDPVGGVTTNQKRTEAYWARQAPELSAFLAEAEAIHKDCVNMLDPASGGLSREAHIGEFEERLDALRELALRVQRYLAASR